MITGVAIFFGGGKRQTLVWKGNVCEVVMSNHKLSQNKAIPLLHFTSKFWPDLDFRETTLMKYMSKQGTFSICLGSPFNCTVNNPIFEII